MNQKGEISDKFGKTIVKYNFNNNQSYHNVNQTHIYFIVLLFIQIVSILGLSVVGVSEHTHPTGLGKR